MVSAAGCLFVSEQHVLAGYQPHKKTPVISGFGGKRNPGEEPITTAWRETLEELLGWSEVPQHILITGMSLPPKQTMNSNGYMQAVYSFEDLETVLNSIPRNIFSPLYNSIPRSVAELVFHRIHTVNTEVPTLCILPMRSQKIANHFVKDILEATGRTQCHESFTEGPLFAEE